MIEDFVGNAVFVLVDLLLSILPMSPFLGLSIDGMPEEALGWLCWAVDVNGMLDLLGAWLLCVLAYMVARQVLDVVRQFMSDGNIGLGILGALGGIKDGVLGFLATLIK